MRSAATLVAAVVLALVAATSAGAGSTKVVKLQDVDISPSTVRVAKGGTVEWRFLDARAAHNVTSRGRPRFRSSSTKRSGTHRVTFRKAGTYRYVCTIHANMRGKVVVR